MMVGKDGKGRHRMVDTFCCHETSGFIPKVPNLYVFLAKFLDISKSYIFVADLADLPL